MKILIIIQIKAKYFLSLNFCWPAAFYIGVRREIVGHFQLRACLLGNPNGLFGSLNVSGSAKKIFPKFVERKTRGHLA